MVVERRKGFRMAVVWKAMVTRVNREQLPGSSDTVSTDGLNIIIGKQLVVGERVGIELVASNFGRVRYFSLVAEVVYSRELDCNLGLATGMRILKADPEYQYWLTLLEQGGEFGQTPAG